MRHFRIVALAAVVFLAAIGAFANPYGVAGGNWYSGGEMPKLGMPADSYCYVWDNLEPTNQVQMIRPCKYWAAWNPPHRFWGYHESTNTIDNPTQFANWIKAHPGKVWILGNEPDHPQQDDMSQSQCAKMFKTYRDFILKYDPSARLAIGGITGGSTAAKLTYSKSWLQSLLNSYKSQYNTPMPIDIWNVHSYAGGYQAEDPDKIINEFIQPFVNWVHTVDGGAYSNSEVWITEFPIGEWWGALGQENVIAFAKTYLPRVEAAGVSRFFWFASQDWDGWWTNIGLLSQDGSVSPLGQAYSELAHGYPNPVPPVEPFIPPPTPIGFTDGFDTPLQDAWLSKAGDWETENSALRQSSFNYPWLGQTCVLQYSHGDSVCKFRMKINRAADPTDWAGAFFRLKGRFDWVTESGYLLFMRQNGEVCLSTRKGISKSVRVAIANPTAFNDFTVVLRGYTIEIWVNGVKKITWTDKSKLFARGYPALAVGKADASFDSFQITQLTGNITDAKLLPEGPTITLNNQLVTAKFPASGTQDRFYIESPDRSSGIQVRSTKSVSEGQIVNISGTVSTYTGERGLSASSVSIVSSGNPLPQPLATTALSTGGSDFFYNPMLPVTGQLAAYGSAGMNNIGTLVTVTGQVTSVPSGASYFYVNDGTLPSPGVMIRSQGVTRPLAGQSIRLTGISTIYQSGANLAAIRVRKQADVQVLSP